MSIEIKHRIAEQVLHVSEKKTIQEAVEEAIEKEVDLSFANLRYADLRDADLRNANLCYANLRNANLRNANLRSANLCDANLRNANLRDADLRNANLCYANLSNANLRNANLSDANLSFANLAQFKNDIFEILLNAPAEVATLKTKLIAGEIDGSCYEPECGMACLCGTIAIARGCGYAELPGIKPDSSRPAEQWFFNIHPGCTPDTNAVAAITLDWIEEFEQKLAQAITTMENAHKCI